MNESYAPRREHGGREPFELGVPLGTGEDRAYGAVTEEDAAAGDATEETVRRTVRGEQRTGASGTGRGLPGIT